MSQPNCSGDTCLNGEAGIHYVPSSVGNAAFLVLFIGCLVGQCTILFLRRLWGYSIFVGIAIILEIMGYAAKLNLRHNQKDSNNYIMYIICLTIAPNFISGVLYVSLSRFIWALGRQYSLISPSLISWGFITADFLCLSAVGVGGSLAAIFAPSLLGAYIMIGGLAGQAAFTLAFGCLCLDYWARRRRRSRSKEYSVPPTYLGEESSPAVERFGYVVGIASACMLVRSGYRVAELSKGFNGPLAQNEKLFFVLDSIPVIFTCILLTILPPHQDIWYARKEVIRRR